MGSEFIMRGFADGPLMTGVSTAAKASHFDLLGLRCLLVRCGWL